MSKLISFIVCAYNAEKTISRAIGSLLNPSFSDFIEIVIVDDGSDDSTSDLIEMYRKFDFVKIITQKNFGLGKARNVGLLNATSDFVTFCDADDIFFVDNYVDLAKEASLHGFNMACSQSFALVGGEAISDFWDSGIIKIIKKTGNGVDNLLKFLLQPSVCNKIFKRDFVIREGIKFSEGVLFEDVEFTSKALLAVEKILFSEKPVFLYDFKGSGTITAEKSLRRFDIFRNIDALFPALSSAKLNILQTVVLSVSLMRTVLWCLDNVPLTHRQQFVAEIIAKFSLLNPGPSAKEMQALAPFLTDRWDRRALYTLDIVWNKQDNLENEISNFEELFSRIN